MSNAVSLFRSLVIYGITLPLAILLGYLLATPEDFTTSAVIGLVLAFMSLPLVLRWHRPLLFLTWNMVAIVPFLPGHPQVFLVACAISLTVSILQYTLNRQLKFIHVPSITWPLLFLTAVVLITARLTGGIGLRVTGGESMGGKKYVALLSATAGYFALTAQRIPPHRVMRYVLMYFLGTLTAVIGELANVANPAFYFIFSVFPAEVTDSGSPMVGAGDQMSRMGGLMMGSTAVIMALLAKYGIRGVFDLRKFWRLALFLGCGVVSLLGGFRSSLILLTLVFVIQFYLEGLFRSRLLPVLLIVGTLVAAVSLPFADRLPLSVQRTLSFLPAVPISPIADIDAKASTEWRVQMWQRVLPEVPKHLLLGKGYSLSAADMDMVQLSAGKEGTDPFDGSLVAMDYHNGPLSTIIPLGIWGVIGVTWFLVASVKVMYRNYLFGDPEFKGVNTFLLAYFLAKIIIFVFIFGGLNGDMVVFTGIVGLSICVNGGARSPAPVNPVARPVFNRFKLAGAIR